MIRKIKGLIDWIAICLGIVALIFNILLPSSFGKLSITLCVIAGIFGLCYLLYALKLLLIRPKFDNYLFKGNFLLKVTAFVLLVPSIITSVILVSDNVTHTEYSTKNILNDENLYSQNSSVTAPLQQHDPSLFWSVYIHFVDAGNQTMAGSESGRRLAALISILGVFLVNGLLVSLIVGWIDSRKEKWLKGEVEYNLLLHILPHYIIIGGNDMVASIVKQILANCDNSSKFGVKPYVLIQTSGNVESFRRELFSSLDNDEQERIIIYYGNRTLQEDIEKLQVNCAKEVYILGEDSQDDDTNSYHDTMNMRCLELINDEYAKCQHSSKLLCRVLFEYQSTFSVFQFFDIDKKMSAQIDFKPFNYYEMWADRLFVNTEFLPLEGEKGISAESDDYVHLFVVGMSRMGVALGIKAAHLAHYPNFETKGKRTKITFIDKCADEQRHFFIGRFKELFDLSHWRTANIDGDNLKWSGDKFNADNLDYLGGDFLDVEWEFINGGVESVAVQNYILKSANANARVTIAICYPESNRSHATALYLNKEIYASQSVQQVLVYNRYGNSIMEALKTDQPKAPYYNKLKAFGVPSNCFNANYLMQAERIGRCIDERYNQIYDKYLKELIEKQNKNSKKVSYKGKSATANFWSSVYNGNTLWTKLRSIDYQGGELTTEEIQQLACVEHNRWNIEQLLMNFRPLTKQEQDSVINGGLDKDELKGKMAHLNICSNKRLVELSYVDEIAIAYDKGLTELLPEIYSKLK